MKTIYRVNQIRSQRATERENLEPRTIEKHVGDFDSMEDAQAAYNNTATGMEADKELLKIEGDNEQVINTTL